MDSLDFLKIQPFTKDNFRTALINEHYLLDALDESRLALYLFNYLKSPDLNAKTMVIEDRYTDGDYLEDFAAYYVRCFAHYKKRCKRLHFFSIECDTETFRAAVMSNDDCPDASGKLTRKILSSQDALSELKKSMPRKLYDMFVASMKDGVNWRKGYGPLIDQE